MGLGTGFWRSRWACVAAVTGFALALGTAPAAAAATTITVNTTESSSPSGDGLCSLWEAVDWSQGGSEPDCSLSAPSGPTTIQLPAGKYVVPRTLFLNDTLSIVGTGASQTDIDGGGSAQVMYVYPGANVQISGVEISGGESGTASCTTICTTTEPGNDGGGIYNDGTLTLNDDLITGNTTGHGIAGLQLCLAVSCAGNDGGGGGNGGGIYNDGTLTIADSTVSGNTTGAGAAGNDGFTYGTGAGEPGGRGGNGGGGAGIYNYGGTLTVTDSTISGNTTGAGGDGGSGSNATQSNTGGGAAGAGGFGGGGGGIESFLGSVTITGSTLDANSTGAGSAPGTPGSGNGSGGFGTAGVPGNAGIGGAFAYNATGGPTATLANDTLTANGTGAAAAGVDPVHGGIAGAIAFLGTGSLTNVTIAGNSATYGAGAIYLIPGSTLTERNSVIAANTATLQGNCAGLALTDGGHNVVYGDASCPGTVGDPMLQPLAGNGGPTQTMRLGAGSAAVDLVPSGSCGVTTDQRGVARPQGGGCDAGAYELAPPTLASPAAAATAPSSATVSARIDANLQDTRVTVRYGTSSAYGSTTASTDLGSGASASPFSVALTGLSAGTVYHVEVVASNADGTTTSSDLTLTTPAAMTAHVASAVIHGDAISVELVCTAGGATCAGAFRLTSRVTTVRGKVVAVTARAKRKTVVRTMGSGGYALAAGQSKSITVKLNAAAQRLLKARRRLPTTLTLTGPIRVTAKVTFIYKPPHRKT